jgi:DUF1680 family protein
MSSFSPLRNSSDAGNPARRVMTKHFSRREFVAGAGVAGIAALLPRQLLAMHRSVLAGIPVAERRGVAQPFDLASVRLKAGPFLDATEVNRRYLLGLDPDSLLHMFRITAGLPSSATPLGGWEAPDNELRGHFVGHYLSACALMGASRGDAETRDRGTAIVQELAKCQKAIGNGYLSAFPEELFDRVRAGKPAWAPFYTIHKIMAGLLDTYELSGDQQSLDVLKGMARWTAGWTGPLGDDAMARVLEREYGGMNETLYNLAAVTGNKSYMDLAHRFDHERIFEPLAMGRDALKGVHVNTTIPKIIGAGRRYELTSERRYHDVASYFWDEVTSRRSYCTGGTSNGENWNAEPGIISTELGPETEECCPTYNMLKLTRHLFQWNADPRAADYYERALFNGILGTQHPADGSKLYYVPLASGYWKQFGTRLHDFWCCTGTGAESFSKLGDSIYFRDDDGVYVNLFVASDLTWKEKGIRIAQTTRFPEEDSTTLTIDCDKPTKMALRIRIPYWATSGGSVSLNGKKLDGFAAPSSFFVLDRVWHKGDTVKLTLPMQLRAEPTPDDPSVLAIMYGPLVLAGKLGTEGLTADNLRAPPTKPRMVPEFPKNAAIAAPTLRPRGSEASEWIERTGPLEFRTKGQERDVTLVPFSHIIDERYAVYWKTV